MPTRRYYSNFAPRQTLANSIGSSDTTCQVAGSFAGWPVQFPYYATLGYGLSSAEIVQVTNVIGKVATIVRGQDGSVAVSHPAGETLDQTASRIDYDEANAHTSANSGVHGVSGNVVGDSDTQTLSNKTFTDPTVNAATLTGTIINRAVLSGDASDPAVLGKSASGGKMLSLEDHTGTEKVSVDDSGNLIVAGTATLGAITAPTLSLTSVTSVTDWNSATKAGFYYAASSAANAPDAINNYVGTVFLNPGASAITQTVWAQGATPTGYQRTYNGSTWSTWAPFTTLPKQLFVATQATAQSLASGSWGWISFDTTVVDTASGHSNTVNNYRYTCNQAGYWRLTGRFALASAAAHVQSVGIAINGSTPVPSTITEIYTASAGYTPVIQTSTVQYLNNGDWCSVMGEHTVGSATSTSGGGCEFTAEWLHN